MRYLTTLIAEDEVPYHSNSRTDPCVVGLLLIFEGKHWPLNLRPHPHCGFGLSPAAYCSCCALGGPPQSYVHVWSSQEEEEVPDDELLNDMIARNEEEMDIFTVSVVVLICGIDCNWPNYLECLFSHPPPSLLSLPSPLSLPLSLPPSHSVLTWSV